MSLESALSTLTFNFHGLSGTLRQRLDTLSDSVSTFLRTAKESHTQETSERKAVEDERDRLRKIIDGLHLAAQDDDSLDSVSFVFPDSKETGAAKIKLSRGVVSQWSPEFRALVKHGNGLSGTRPEEIVLHGVESSAFKELSEFMRTGVLPDGAVKPLDAADHPLLKLADQYGPRDVVDSYFKIMENSCPLGDDTAGKLLELALQVNAEDMVRRAATLLADSPTTFVEGGAFMSLSAEAAAAVLQQDDLRMCDDWEDFWNDPDQEPDILHVVNRWAIKNGAGPAKVGLLLNAIRLDLFSFDDLTSLKDKLVDLQALGDARDRLRADATEMLKQRLTTPVDDTSQANLRKRKYMDLANPEKEEKQRKLIRAAMEMVGSFEIQRRHDGASNSQNAT